MAQNLITLKRIYLSFYTGIKFLLRLSFSVTSQKSAHFEKVILSETITHAQLYVTLSGYSSLLSVKIKEADNEFEGIKRDKCITKDVVFKEILF